MNFVVKNWSPETSSLPITTGSPYDIVSVARLPLGALSAGDLVSFTAGVEVTTSYTYNIMHAGYAEINGLKMTRPRGENFNMEEHHHLLDFSGFYSVPVTGSYELVLFNYAASSKAQPGHALRVDYVDLQAAITRGC